MQVFKTYFKLLKKNWVPILIYTVLFLSVTILISGNNIENTRFEASKVRTMIVNEDGESEFVKNFLEYLEGYAEFVETKESEEARRDSLFYRETKYILTIPRGFTEDFLKNGDVRLVKEAVPDSAEALSIDNAVNNYLNMARRYLDYIPDVSMASLNAYVVGNLKEEAVVSINMKEEDAVANSNNFNMNYYNYLGYIMIATFITGVSLVMLSFHGLDIRRRHSASPLSNRNMNLQLILANLIYVFGFLLLFIITGYILNKEHIINGNTWMTWLNAAAFTVTALSISYLVGIAVKNRRAVSAIATGLSLCLAFLSGIFVPQQFLGATVLKFASFTPTYWYVKANSSISTLSSFSWTDLSGVIGYIAIQIGFAAAIFSIALVVSKRKRQQTV